MLGLATVLSVRLLSGGDWCSPDEYAAIFVDRAVVPARQTTAVHLWVRVAGGAAAVEVIAEPIVARLEALNAPATVRGPVLRVAARDWPVTGDAGVVLRLGLQVGSVGRFHLGRVRVQRPGAEPFERELRLDFSEDPEAVAASLDAEVTRGIAHALDERGYVAAVDRDALQACLRERPYHLALDPGHEAAGNRGALSAGGRWEVAFNDDLVEALTQRLGAFEGLVVHRTRAPDESLDLRARVARLREWPLDMVLSVHHDSVKKSRMRERAVNEAVAVPGGSAQTCDDRRGFSIFVPTAGHRGGVSYQLARQIAHGWLQRGRPIGRFFAHGEPARGIFSGDRLFLVARAPAPVVLVEVGYLCNPREERLLLASVGEQAKVLARALERHLWAHHCRAIDLASPWWPGGADLVLAGDVGRAPSAALGAW